MANFANPTVGSNYTDFPGEIRASVDAALQQLSVGTHTNIPTGAIKFDTSANRWKKFNGSAFVDLTSTYDLNAVVSVNELQLEDNEKIKLGNSQDLLIYHDSSHSYIEDAGTGQLRLKAGGFTVLSTTDEAMIKALQNNQVELYFDNDKKLETNINGIQVTNRVGIGGVAGQPLDVFGNAQIGASSTGDAELIIGRSGSGNRNAYIDLVGDNTYSDYGVRLLRGNIGANSSSEIRHRGTGSFNFINNEAAEFRFYTSANQKAVITSDGRLGIGTTSPSSELVVRGSTPQITLEPTSDAQTCRYQFATTNGTVQSTIQSGGSLGAALKYNNTTTEVFRFISNTRLGLGTSSPEAKLDVVDGSSLGIISRSSATQATDSNKAIKVRNNSTALTFSVSYRGAGYFARQLLIGTDTNRSPGGVNPNLQVEGTNSSTSSLSLTRNSADTGSASFTFNKTRGTSVGADVAVNNADTLGIIQFVGNDGTDSDHPAAWIVGKVDGPVSSNVMPGRLEFYTNTGGTSVSLRAIIKEGGQFLIGKTSADGPNSLETIGAARFQAPSDFWSTASAFYGVAGYGYLGTHGAFETTLVSGGYRKGSSQWQNYTINGTTGNATMIAMGTQSSYIALRLETGKANGSSSAVSDRFRFFPTASLSIASTTEKSKLYINGGESETGGILVENVLYSGNQDKPFLIAGTQNWTGATTNWGTFGFQFRIKTDSAGSPRFAIQTVNGEALHVKNDGKIGINTTVIDGARLNVFGTSGNNPTAQICHSNADTVGEPLRFARTDSETIRYHSIKARHSGNAANNHIAFNIHNSSSTTSQTETLKIGGDGIVQVSSRLYINRTSGSFSLDIDGAARITDRLYMTNDKRIEWGSSNVSFIQGNDNDHLIFGVNNEVGRMTQNRMVIGQTSDSTVGLGNTNTGISLEKNGRMAGSTSGTTTGLSLNANVTSNSKHYISMRNSGTQIGSVTQNGASNVAYNSFSDRRVKENIAPLLDALTTLLKLKPVNYNYKADKEKKKFDGFIAQDLLEDKVCDYAATYVEREDWYGIDYSKLVTIAIAAIQELAGKVSDLEAKSG